jgi:hypothetical protein
MWPLEGQGWHSGDLTVAAILLGARVLLGAKAALVALLVLGPLYLKGAYDRGAEHERLQAIKKKPPSVAAKN